MHTSHICVCACSLSGMLQISLVALDGKTANSLAFDKQDYIQKLDIIEGITSPMPCHVWHPLLITLQKYVFLGKKTCHVTPTIFMNYDIFFEENISLETCFVRKISLGDFKIYFVFWKNTAGSHKL